LFDKIRDGTHKHQPHPGLDAAATSAAIKVQAGGGWTVATHKSPSDTAPLLAVIGAVWQITANRSRRRAGISGGGLPGFVNVRCG
jgi:hypothetical protein